jgi:hypothetical protein
MMASKYNGSDSPQVLASRLEGSACALDIFLLVLHCFLAFLGIRPPPRRPVVSGVSKGCIRFLKRVWDKNTLDQWLPIWCMAQGLCGKMTLLIGEQLCELCDTWHCNTLDRPVLLLALNNHDSCIS